MKDARYSHRRSDPTGRTATGAWCDGGRGRFPPAGILSGRVAGRRRPGHLPWSDHGIDLVAHSDHLASGRSNRKAVTREAHEAPQVRLDVPSHGASTRTKSSTRLT